jgi:hypothetical protein
MDVFREIFGDRIKDFYPEDGSCMYLGNAENIAHNDTMQQRNNRININS